MDSQDGNGARVGQLRPLGPVSSPLPMGSRQGATASRPHTDPARRTAGPGRARKVVPLPAAAPMDLEALARQRPTLPVVELPAVLGHVPGFSSRSAVFRRARAGTLPGLVRGQGHRAYVVTAVLVRHLLGLEAA